MIPPKMKPLLIQQDDEASQENAETVTNLNIQSPPKG